MDPADRVLGEQVHDPLGQVVGVGGCPPLVADDLERLPGGRGSTGGGQDPAREVRVGRPEQPGRPDDAELAVAAA